MEGMLRNLIGTSKVETAKELAKVRVGLVKAQRQLKEGQRESKREAREAMKEVGVAHKKTLAALNGQLT